MKHLFFSVLLFFFFITLKAQKSNRLSIEINYGIHGSFFVRSYEEYSPSSSVQLFYKKRFIGNIAGLELKYNLTANAGIGLAYAKSVNKRKVNYNGPNGGLFNFTITHVNQFYQLFYEHAVSKKALSVKLHGGIYYLRTQQQEVDASPFGIFGEERDYKHNKLEEGGFFAGVHFSKKIDTKFELGIKTRIYYTVSTGSLESITLTPALTYHF